MNICDFYVIIILFYKNNLFIYCKILNCHLFFDQNVLLL